MVQPITTEKRGSKRLAVGNPGAIGSRCDAGLLRGTYERCRGESTDQTTINVVTDEVLTFGLKSWSRGQKSQAASAVCSGGVSAVMGSSDLDGHTFHPSAVNGYPSQRSLPSRLKSPRFAFNVPCTDHSPPARKPDPRWEYQEAISRS